MGLLQKSRRLKKRNKDNIQRKGLRARALEQYGLLETNNKNTRGLLSRAASVIEQKKKYFAEDNDQVEDLKNQDSQSDIEQVQYALDKKVFDLTNLFEVSKEINSTLILEELLNILLFTCMGQVSVSKVFICTKNKDGDYPLCLQKGLDSIEHIGFQFTKNSPISTFLINENKPVLFKDLPFNDKDFERDFLAEASAELIIPLLNKNLLTGILVLGKRYDDKEYSSDDQEYLFTLASMAAVAVDNARLYANLEQKLNQLSALYDISKIINSSDVLEQVLQLAIETLSTGFGLNKAAFISIEDDSFIINKSIGISDETEKNFKIDSTNELLDSVLELGEVLEVSDLNSNNELISMFDKKDLDSVQSILFIPLLAGGKKVGILSIFSTDGKKEFSKEEKELYSIIASQIAPPILMAKIVESTSNNVIDPFNPFMSEIIQETNSANSFSLSLGIMDVQIIADEKLYSKIEPVDIYSLSGELGKRIRSVIDEKYKVIRKNVFDYVVLVPGISSNDKDSILKLLNDSILEFFNENNVSEFLSVQIDFSLIPEDYKDSYSYIFKKN